VRKVNGDIDVLFPGISGRGECIALCQVQYSIKSRARRAGQGKAKNCFSRGRGFPLPAGRFVAHLDSNVIGQEGMPKRLLGPVAACPTALQTADAGGEGRRPSKVDKYNKVDILCCFGPDRACGKNAKTLGLAPHRGRENVLNVMPVVRNPRRVNAAPPKRLTEAEL